MNGPTWVYRVKTYHPRPPGDARISVQYFFDRGEAARAYRSARAEGIGAMFASAVLSDFYDERPEDV
ncbi:hypothetical protein AB0F77_39605 [Streptomyces sp. NPDC026672]|uniref:hypothetical protein n=1 Tax=Actinomycetes TaxID=1760 RepID=UPI0033FB027A